MTAAAASVVVPTGAGVSRAYAPRVPTYQRFHQNGAPASSDASDGGSGNGNGNNGSNPYARQYSHVYSARLAALRGRCVSDALRCAGVGGIVVNAPASTSSSEDDDADGLVVADRIIEAREGPWTILVGTIVREAGSPDRRPPVGCGGHDVTVASDAFDYLFPPPPPLRRVGGKAVQEPLRSSRWMAHDAKMGDAMHLEDDSGRVELEPMADEDDGGGGDGGADGGSNEPSTSTSTSPWRALDPNAVATGVVAAVIGRVCGDRGVMKVRSVHFAGPPPPPEHASSSSLLLRGPTTTTSGDRTDDDDDDDDDGPVLLLVSGLGCGSDSPADAASPGGGGGSSLAVRREMLLEYLTNPTLSDGASVCRVIVAGGGIGPPRRATPAATIRDDGDDREAAGGGGGVGGESSNGNTGGKRRRDYNVVAASESSTKNSRTNDAAARVANSLRELDLYLSEMLASGIPVDYVPGWHDPTNASWPQRPLHPCLLPYSASYGDNMFGRGTNPYECLLGGGDGDKGGGDGVRVLGSDGLNVADLRRFLSTKKGGDDDLTADDSGGGVGFAAPSCIDALHRTFAYGHVAPTGPDSLPTFPSCEFDPFVMSSRPDVYFAGNCDEFETRLVDGRGDAIDERGAAAASATANYAGAVTRLVCVPSFALTGEVVLVKLRSLECEVLSFSDASL